MKNLAEAIVKVMQEESIRYIAKTMNVGTGQSSYKGVSDREVREIFQPILAKHGLSLLPISIDANAVTDRWEEESTYNGKTQRKQKQSTFTTVTVKYLLLHSVSGESVELAGYGQGVDSQDKGAGKATTYALKNVLLNTFLVPTINEDTDNHHSDDMDVPKADAISFKI